MRVLLRCLLILVAAYTCLKLSHMITPERFLASVPRSVAALVATRLSGNAVIVAVIVSFIAAASLLGASFMSVGTAINLLLDLAIGQAVCIEGRTSTSLDSDKGQGIETGECIDHHYYVVHE